MPESTDVRDVVAELDEEAAVFREEAAGHRKLADNCDRCAERLEATSNAIKGVRPNLWGDADRLPTTLGDDQPRHPFNELQH